MENRPDSRLYAVGESLPAYQADSSLSMAVPLTSLYGSYDGETIRLATPYTFQPGDRLIITVLPHDEELAEREEWFALSAAGLEEAYGDDEPEYTLAHVKERNPAYAGG